MSGSPAAPRERVVFEVLFLGLALGCLYPLYNTRYAPLQDLPQHLAAIRVLHDFHDPTLAFSRYFELDLFRTQYLAYYLAADLLAYVLDVERANELLVMLSMIGTPYALRGLLTALGKDGRMALLAFPLAYNAHLILGFFNFVAAIPLAFYGLTLGVRQLRAPSAARGLGLSVVCLVCFYTHVVPFGLLAAGLALVSLPAAIRAAASRLLPLAPSAVATLVWFGYSPAGRATLGAARADAARPHVETMTVDQALAALPQWLTDVLRVEQDRELLVAWAALLGVATLVAAGEWLLGLVRPTAAPEGSPDPTLRGARLRLSLLPLACAMLYFVLPTGYDWIWPIAPRFPLLAALWLIVVLPEPRALRTLVLAAAYVISAASFHFVGQAFARFEREEVSDLDAALAVIPPGQRVVGLIFDRYSRHVAFSPFIHYVAYYQARKGGAVMFSFADFAHSPFRFRQDDRPPRVPPRWEWKPERVRPATDLAYYDYALVRGGPGAISRPGSGFSLRYRGERFRVYQRER